jgi:hypothetical protein
VPDPKLRALARAAVILLALAGPIGAAEWSPYSNARFGYVIDIPPDFLANGEAANGDGEAFATPTARLAVFGQFLMTPSIEDEARARAAQATEDDWGITYQMSTPHAASYSGKRGSRILYVRMIALCDGAAFGAFELDYSMVDRAQFDAIISRLVRGFKSADGAC